MLIIVAHARYRLVHAACFIFSDIISSGHYLESFECCKKLSLSVETQVVRVVCLSSYER